MRRLNPGYKLLSLIIASLLLSVTLSYQTEPAGMRDVPAGRLSHPGG